MYRIYKFIGNRHYNKTYEKFWRLAHLIKNYSSSSSSSIGLPNVEPKNCGTMDEVRLKMAKGMGSLTGFIRETEKRDHLLKYTPTKEELPLRTMSDSYIEALIPLSISEELQVHYVSHVGTVRLGRLMEQMDFLAGWICQQHVLLPNLPPNVPLPYTFVTILVDKMIFSKLLAEYNQDIRLSGFVSWVGTSSMEVSIWLEQKHENKFRLITHAIFLMAARNATNTKSAAVNTLQPCTDYERNIFNLGAQRQQTRKRLSETSIFKLKPTEKEHDIMYKVFKETTDKTNLQLNKRILPKNCRWMSDSFTVNTFLTFPENRNNHNTVFGGFIMRQSYEISWMCAFLHCGYLRPSCEGCCDISFQKPIKINSIIKMTAYVVYSENQLIQTMTVAEVIDPSAKGDTTTNVFYYTFRCQNKAKTILPKTYHETMWYIHGRRKLYYTMETLQNSD